MTTGTEQAERYLYIERLYCDGCGAEIRAGERHHVDVEAAGGPFCDACWSNPIMPEEP